MGKRIFFFKVTETPSAYIDGFTHRQRTWMEALTVRWKHSPSAYMDGNTHRQMETLTVSVHGWKHSSSDGNTHRQIETLTVSVHGWKHSPSDGNTHRQRTWVEILTVSVHGWKHSPSDGNTPRQRTWLETLTVSVHGWQKPCLRLSCRPPGGMVYVVAASIGCAVFSQATHPRRSRTGWRYQVQRLWTRTAGLIEDPYQSAASGSFGREAKQVISVVSIRFTLRASLSGTFLQTLKNSARTGYATEGALRHSVFIIMGSCPPTRSAPSERFGC